MSAAPGRFDTAHCRFCQRWFTHRGLRVHITRVHRTAQATRALPDAPRTFAEIREYLRPGRIEGIVWHHPDGRMVKIKAKDFGFKRAALTAQEAP